MGEWKKQLDFIRKAFQKKKLPGLNVMLEMAPLERRKKMPVRKNPSMASVMLLLYPFNDELYFPLIIRPSSNSRDKHRGQISFPGGKKEKIDHDNWSCAVRETSEELGIEIKNLEFIGKLTNNFIPVSNFKMHPFVGHLKHKPTFNKQDEEVAEILEIPLKKILDPSIKKTGEVSLAEGIRLDNIPYFAFDNHKIWGATAMILNEFISLLNKKI